MTFLLRRLFLAGLMAWGAAAPLCATTVVPPEFGELVNGSDYIVRARVTAVSYEARVRGEREIPYTRVELEVLEVIAGAPPKPLVLVMLGGRIGERTLVVEGAPQFAVGDEDILFVSGNGRTIYPLYGLMHGRYPVLREAQSGRAYVARSNGLPLRDPAEVSLPVPTGPAAEIARRLASSADALTPETFAAQIKAALTRPSAP